MELTQIHYEALKQKIYDAIMADPDAGLGEMGEARDEADRIVNEWMEENEITVTNL